MYMHQCIVKVKNETHNLMWLHYIVIIFIQLSNMLQMCLVAINSIKIVVMLQLQSAVDISEALEFFVVFILD